MLLRGSQSHSLGVYLCIGSCFSLENISSEYVVGYPLFPT